MGFSLSYDQRASGWSRPIFWWECRIFLPSALSSSRTVCPSRERRHAWMVEVRRGWPLVCHTSALKTNWYHLMPNSVGRQDHWSKALSWVCVHPLWWFPNIPNHTARLSVHTCCTWHVLTSQHISDVARKGHGAIAPKLLSSPKKWIHLKNFLTSFATNVPQNVTIGVQSETFYCPLHSQLCFVPQFS